MGRYGGEEPAHNLIDSLVWQAFLLQEFVAWAIARKWQG